MEYRVDTTDGELLKSTPVTVQVWVNDTTYTVMSVPSESFEGYKVAATGSTELPAEVQLGLRDRRVDMGHARALLAVENPKLQLKLYNEIIKRGLSVRQVEELAKQYNGHEPETGGKAPRSQGISEEYELLKNHLSQSFHTQVQFTCNRQGRGKITFPFKNEQELERLISIFDRLKGNLD